MLSKILSKLGISDSATAPTDGADEEFIRLLNAYVEQSLDKAVPFQRYDPGSCAAGAAILELDRESHAKIITIATPRLNAVVHKVQTRGTANYTNFKERTILQYLISNLLRQRLPFNEAQLVQLLANLTDRKAADWLPAQPCVRAVEQYFESQGAKENLCQAIAEVCNRLESPDNTAPERKLIARLRKLCKGEAEVRVPLSHNEKWSAAVLDFLAVQPPEYRNGWAGLLSHAATATASKPARVWLKTARQAIERIGTEACKAKLLEWFTLVEKGGRNEPPRGLLHNQPDEHLVMDAFNAQTLKGLAWSATVLDNSNDVVQAIGRLGVACYRKIPNLGARSVSVANACVWALGIIPGQEAVGQLSVLRGKSKYRAAQQGVAKALNAAAEREGVSTEELEEMAVQKYRLMEVGRGIEQLGEYAAELAIVDTRTVELNWISLQQKVQKSIPAIVKRDFATTLKELKAAQKSILGALPVLRGRIESAYLREKSWNFNAWRERYLDHPLVGALARRLIWNFETAERSVTGAWDGSRLVDVAGQRIEHLSDDCRVKLWHPACVAANTVLAWREWLARHAVTQPFKQAHREVYLLTDAERMTDTYSNRFAAHILRQHQFTALCRERGWRYSLQGTFDSANNAVIELPHWKMVVELWIDAPGADQSGTGIFLYVSTDQLRFYRANQADPMRLSDVPQLVFSELMRDVDLFVGVCSMGTDQNWADTGPEGAYHAYWREQTFGNLSLIAATRREVLKRLVPQLAIADRCELDNKFLHVRGNIRSYKIHLGSSNILMSPNDAYLCIVPERGRAAVQHGKVYLPFEGDGLLSVIISKALMLAADDKITDPTITRQIQL